MHSKKSLLSIGYFLFWALVFAISYTPWPLYSSNQNTRFLHGLAAGGLGFLKEDWLAGTTDSFPVFSLLVSITYRSLHQYLFYFYYILILGIYVYSIVGIASYIYNIKSARPKYLTYLALVIAIHSSAGRYLWYKVFGVDLVWYLQSGVAGLYILGSVFQPSIFGVLIILSIYIFLQRKPFLAVFFATLAVTFHFTYLLSAAVLTLSYIIITFKEEKSLKRAALIGLFALILVLPVLTYVYVSFDSTSSEIWSKAQDILINFRSPHHYVPKRWLEIISYGQILIIIAALYLIRKTKLFLVMLFSFLTATTLTIIQILLDSNSLALLLPWRASVFIVPISTCIIAAHIVSYFFEKFSYLISKNQKVVILLGAGTIFLVLIGGVVNMKLIFDPDFKKDTSIPMMDFVRKTKSPGQIYLIPTGLEKFRLYAGAPIFVDSKSHPWKDIEVIEWYNRILAARSFYREDEIDCQMLKKLSVDYGVTHVILENRHFSAGYSFLRELYKDDDYGVFKINTE